MPKYKGILFDKDGTIVDFQKTWFAIGDKLALEATGGDRERADRLMSAAGYDFQTKGFRPDSVFAAGTNADVVALWYPHLPDVMRKELITHFDSVTAVAGAAKAIPIPGAVEALTALHETGYKLGMATNDSTAGASQTLLMFGVLPLFSAAYGYDAVPNPKPAPDTVEAFCKLTAMEASEVIMVGDNKHDLDMARRAGAGLAVGVLSGTGTRETLADADVILDSVADLPAFLADAAQSQPA